MERFIPSCAVLFAAFEEKGGFCLTHVLVRPAPNLTWSRNMDNHKYDLNLKIEDLERKAAEFITLMFSMCEERLRDVSAVPDARASSLAHAVMAAQNAIQTFVNLARIS
jgi:hypothetical protein